MKYSLDIDIHRPIDEVVKLFDSFDNMKKWQPGFISHEHISGTPGEPGAVTRLRYKMGKREIEMIETVKVRDLPHQFSGTYDAKGVHNIIHNSFEKIDESATRWITHQEFQFKGFMKVIGFIMPGAFKKQSMTYLEKFKEFCEGQ